MKLDEVCMARPKHAVVVAETFTSPLQNSDHECRILLGHLSRKRGAITAALERLQSMDNKPSEVVQTIHILADVLRPDYRLDAVEKEWYGRHNRAIEVLRFACPVLTLQEIHVCLCIVDNMNTIEIADELCRSEKTVDHYRQSIRQKLGIKGGKTALQNTLRALLEEESTP